MSNGLAPCIWSWSISVDLLRRYVFFASQSCIKELLSASNLNRVGNGNDGWKILSEVLFWACLLQKMDNKRGA
ncbi:hypothetical protein F0562_020157 [Nyssa sinensis]|uniref:Uncharacterized protein n=1 Tax=Nyssa sinensis TaxID=561372 RepID=A0A5J5BQD2_9ASTE|nr:hypothetical protein F0562_020157 [Nyssa sinensis]